MQNLPRVILIAFISLVLFIGIGLLGYNAYPPARPTVAQVSVASGTVSLAFTAPSSPVKNAEVTLPLTFSSPSEHLSGVQAEITYDPTYVTALSFTPSSTFPSTLAAALLESGKITFAYGVSAGSGGTIGNGNVGTLKLKVLKPGTTKLVFTQNTITTTTEKTVNTIKNATDLTLTIIDSIFPGDLNSDNAVNLLDFNLLITKFGNPYTLLDFNTIVTNYGKTR